MNSTESLEQRLHAMEQRLHRLESIAAIERVQRIYGYYLDNRMWNEVGRAVHRRRRGRGRPARHLPRPRTTAHVLLPGAWARP